MFDSLLISLMVYDSAIIERIAYLDKKTILIQGLSPR